jgi:hypothetical protein
MHSLIRTTPGLRTITTRLLHTYPSARMASTADLPYKMHVTPDNTGLWRIKQTEEAARKVSELLQEDMEVRFTPYLVLSPQTLSNQNAPLTLPQKYHVFFNDEGYHNHVRPPSTLPYSTPNTHLTTPNRSLTTSSPSTALAPKPPPSKPPTKTTHPTSAPSSLPTPPPPRPEPPPAAKSPSSPGPTQPNPT